MRNPGHASTLIRRKTRRSTWRSVWIVRVAIVVVVSASATACSGGTGSPKVGVPPTSRSLETVARGDVIGIVTLDGEVVANPQITLTAPAAGRLTLLRRSGGFVDRGTPILRVGADTVRSPAAGTLVTLQPGRHLNGRRVPAGLPLVTIEVDGFAIEAATPPDLAYRIFSRDIASTGAIRGGPAGFDCSPTSAAALPALPDPAANLGNSGSAGVGPTFTCLLPTSVYAVAGLRAFVAIRSSVAHGVPTLPVSAVTGQAQDGVVWLYAGGHLRLRRVVLGITDGSVVQIREGLVVGDRVSTYPPDVSLPSR